MPVNTIIILIFNKVDVEVRSWGTILISHGSFITVLLNFS